MGEEKNCSPDWVNKGKTIRELIQELMSFEDQDLKVCISVDDGSTRKPISLVKKSQGVCLLVNCA
jgi:GT2 family glycosyltransferase